MKSDSYDSVMNDPAAVRREVRMSSAQVSGLSKGELAMALAYEVEPLTGIPASEAEVDFRLVDGDDPTVCVYDLALRRRSSRANSSFSRFLPALVAAAVLALLSIAVDAVMMRSDLSSLGKELETRRALDAKIKGVLRAEKTALDEVSSLRSERKAFIAAQEKVSSLRSAWMSLLECIARSCAGDGVLTSLVSDSPFKAKIKATAVSPAAAAEITARLSESCSAAFWRVIPGSAVTGRDASTVVFECGVEYARD